MMKNCVGIVAEYNPFHNGHAYQLEKAKEETGAKYALAAMSGSFVQRGEAACFDKFTRARWALMGGADMVIELPVLFSSANAQRFAEGGVSLLASAGCSSLSFGTEDADNILLRRMAQVTGDEGEEIRERLSFHLSSGKSYPAARSAAIADVHQDEELGRALLSPNNILACEYMKAADKLSPDMQLFPVYRIGAQHDSQRTTGAYASASLLREALERCDMASVRQFMPEYASSEAIRLSTNLSAPLSTALLSDAMLYALRKLGVDGLAALPDVGEGLENAIYSAVRENKDCRSALAAVKSKRYTLARLRRIFISALLGITAEEHSRFKQPLYIRVLGVRNDAKALLGQLSEAASLPVVATRADHEALSDEAKEMFAYDIFAGELLAMASPEPAAAESEFSRQLITV